MADDVYTAIPVLENDQFILRGIDEGRDAEDLLKVYSDKQAVPLFNSDNCGGDLFYYQTMVQMKEALAFWRFSYQNKHFVRWAVEDKISKEVIGTIELFNRKAEDYFSNCGLLRVDLRSDYETVDCINSILSIIVPHIKEWFACDMIATKAVEHAKERICALKHIGFCLSKEWLIGHDGKKYGSYYVKES